MAEQLNKSDFDEMDIVMSQIDTRIFENISATGGSEQHDKAIVKEMLGDDAIDEVMSQINTEVIYQSIPEELIEKYEEAMNEIDDEIVEEMQQEPDVVVDPSAIPEELLAEYEKALLPVKSTDRYLYAYNIFRKWQASYGTESFDEKVILAYFSVSSEKYQPPTLWSMYSMLKKTLQT